MYPVRFVNYLTGLYPFGCPAACGGVVHSSNAHLCLCVSPLMVFAFPIPAIAFFPVADVVSPVEAVSVPVPDMVVRLTVLAVVVSAEENSAPTAVFVRVAVIFV